jgi:signal transduction histidine kinase/ligand-binding sensor domain-containing protein
MLLASLVTPADARNSSGEGLPGWRRTAIDTQDGAPASIHAVAQTPDGYIWVGALDGLYRFDGRSFERVSLPPAARQSEDVDSLLALPTGDLLVGHNWGGVSIVHDGVHQRMRSSLLGTVAALLPAGDASAWMLSGFGTTIEIGRLQRGEWRTVTTFKVSSTKVQAAVAGRDGSLWAIIDGKLVSIEDGGRELKRVLVDVGAGAGLTVDPAGQAWLADNSRLRLLHPRHGQISPWVETVASRVQGAVTSATIVFEGENGLWVADATGSVKHFRRLNRAEAFRNIGSWRSEHRFDDDTRLFQPLPMLVDREGSLWLATALGLEQFSRVPFGALLQSTSRSKSALADTLVLKDGLGDVWIRRRDALYKVTESGALVKQRVKVPATYEPCTSAKGGVWLPSRHDRLMLFGSARAASLRLPRGSDFTRARGLHCVENGSGALWTTGVVDMTLVSASGARAVSFGQEGRRWIGTVTADSKGRLLAYVGKGSLWRSDGAFIEKILSKDNLPLGFIEVMYQGPSHIYLGGDRGLIRYDGKNFRFLSRDRFTYLSYVSGMVQNSKGETWLQSANGVTLISSKDLDHAFDSSTYRPPARLFDLGDGLPGTSPYWNTSTLTSDRWGRIWVATNNGIARHDPGDVALNRVPPPVEVKTIQADALTYQGAHPIVLNPGVSRIRIDYTALSFVNPSRLRFRYKLSGVDRDWIDAGNQRTAEYTNLLPGRYAFHVVAANSDGVWNQVGARVAFDVPARFYQTGWFKAMAVLIGLALVSLLHLWRLAEASRRFRTQETYRADERERIARDLHDTLLQSVQGLVLLVKSFAVKLPQNEDRAQLERILSRANLVVAEGASRITGLRRSARPGDLVSVLRDVISNSFFDEAVEKDFALQGSPKYLQPNALLEIEAIVGEALFNASRHAEATKVAVELTFGFRFLEVLVSDNGRGIDPERQSPAAGSGSGLAGMTERADRIGGQLSINSGAGRGTIIRLKLPARRAYHTPHRFRRVLAHLT